MKSTPFSCLASLAALLALSGPATAVSVTATFDDLPTLPAIASATGLFFANADSSSYHGVVWDSRFVVVGDALRVDPVTPGPLFGIPHSGSYFVTNEGAGANNDGLLITTSMVLTGAWFGRNEYYGFGPGSDQVSISALQGAMPLASVVFELPAPAVAGQPGVMGFVDTSSFSTLTGITGYRIDRRATGSLNGNWTADDFAFVSAAVPEPSSLVLLLSGLGLLVGLNATFLRRLSSSWPARSDRRR